MKRIPDSAPFAQLLSQRVTRRRVLATGATLALAGGSLLQACTSMRPAGGLGFKAIEGSKADAVVLPPGYRYEVIARWGESLWSSVPDLDAARLADGVLLEPGAAERQQRQFGTNCDAIHFFPLDTRGDRGILCVNNEYTQDDLMYPGHPGIAGALRGGSREYASAHSQAVAVSKAAQGVSVVEIARVRGRWQMVKDSRFNRRITAETPMELGGPARGAALLRTQADPDGVRAFGTFANCAGGRERLSQPIAEAPRAHRRHRAIHRAKKGRIPGGVRVQWLENFQIAQRRGIEDEEIGPFVTGELG